jgi:hypothetical protein
MIRPVGCPEAAWAGNKYAPPKRGKFDVWRRKRRTVLFDRSVKAFKPQAV